MSIPSTPVRGYRQLKHTEVETVNDSKRIEEMVLRFTEEVAGMGGVDPRWVAIAKTHFQQGFMALNRSIFKPERLSGESFDIEALDDVLARLAPQKTSKG